MSYALAVSICGERPIHKLFPPSETFLRCESARRSYCNPLSKSRSEFSTAKRASSKVSRFQTSIGVEFMHGRAPQRR
jgi:hypothetical protein